MMILTTDLAETVNQHSVDRCLDMPVTKPSSLFKSTGKVFFFSFIFFSNLKKIACFPWNLYSLYSTGSGVDLGPYGRGDFSVLNEFCGYPAAFRYNTTYSRVSEKEWGTVDSVKKLVEANAGMSMNSFMNARAC